MRVHDEEEDDAQHDAGDHHDGDVARVGYGRVVRGLGRDHVGQVQHVAQGPAGIAALHLDSGGGKVS